MRNLINNLTNLNVKVSVGEPWDFGKGKEQNPFDAIIEQVFISNRSKGNKIIKTEIILLKITQPFPYNNLKCEYLLASPRHEKVGLRDFINGEEVSFNFLRIPESEACTENPFKNEKFNLTAKSFGLIGSIQKI